MNSFFRISLLFFVIVSCKPKDHEFHGQTYKIETISKDIQIPKVIFDTTYKNIKNESSSVEPVYLFYPLEVIVGSDSSNVVPLARKFIFPNGGGRIDLSTILKGQGSFYFYFPAEQFLKLPDLESLYFVSDFPKKVIDGETFGLGCASWVDLKSKFIQFSEPRKTILNTTDQRYLHVSAGYYIFVFRKGNHSYLTHLYLTDSNHESLKCPTK